ncbi:MAG: tRNA (adenosine(37)-N6)-threonylcarbamoyltransferase complex dimerization subunit type 1 TsaB [Oscillospiraceae bacterium]|nr:tRNA (adenosine(37)-N6)-threonylcarbamoyltransferase complex dimerization subunit type 1 TsaB [Oscillospiraceae bacterium]
MRILALETSAKSVSCAVTEDGAVLARGFQCTGLTHSRTLLPMVDAMLQNAEIPMASIDLFAVAAGPGSFTGLRIGVSALKGLAWAAEKPCAGVSTLYAMAQNLAHLDGALLICAMDARRSQVYNALFEAQNGTLKRLCGDRAIGLDALAAEVQNDSRRKIVLGDGAMLAHGYLTQNGVDCAIAPAALRYQDAVGVALAAEGAERCSAQELSISYLRVSQAERERKARLEQKSSQQS